MLPLFKSERRGCSPRTRKGKCWSRRIPSYFFDTLYIHPIAVIEEGEMVRWSVVYRTKTRSFWVFAYILKKLAYGWHGPMEFLWKDTKILLSRKTWIWQSYSFCRWKSFVSQIARSILRAVQVRGWGYLLSFRRILIQQRPYFLFSCLHNDYATTTNACSATVDKWKRYRKR